MAIPCLMFSTVVSGFSVVWDISLWFLTFTFVVNGDSEFSGDG